MNCHPAYFALSYDELLLGEGITDPDFDTRYRPWIGPEGMGVLPRPWKDGGDVDSSPTTHTEVGQGSLEYQATEAQA